MASQNSRNNGTDWACLQLVRPAHAGAGSSQGITTSLRELRVNIQFRKEGVSHASPDKETQGQEPTGRCSSSMKAGAAAVKDASASKPPSAVAEAVSRLAWVESVCKIKCSN
jgi:hypothetical protein